jgi:hypothetical protein
MILVEYSTNQVATRQDQKEIQIDEKYKLYSGI